MQDTEKKPPKTKEQHVLSNDDLIEYMYQHVQFDEIPFDSDPLYDHRQIYSHETAHIEYSLYENIEATAAFNLHMQNENENESSNLKIRIHSTCIIWVDPCQKDTIRVYKQYKVKYIMKNKMKYLK